MQELVAIATASGLKLRDDVLSLVTLGNAKVQLIDQEILLRQLRLQPIDLLLSQSITQSTVIRIIVLHDLLAHFVDSSLDCASIRRHVIANLCNRLPILAAAISKLPREGIGILHVCNTHLGNGILDAKPSRGYVLIDGVHLSKLVIAQGANSAVDAVELTDDCRGIKPTLNIAGSCTATTTIIATIAIAASSPAKQSKQNNQNPLAIVSAPTIIAIVVSGHRRDIGQTRCAHVKHRMILLEKLIFYKTSLI